MKKFTLLVLSVFVGVSVNAQNLLTNGDFEGGNVAWSGNAFNIQCDGGNCFNFADIAVAGNPFDVNLSQAGLDLTQGETYTLTFDASTDPTTSTRTMIVGIGLSGAPFTANTATANLTDTTQNFEFVFTASFGDPNSRVLFDMGAETGVVVIDNVSLVVGGSVGGEPTEAAPTPPGRDPNSVISVYSDAYTDLPNVEFGAFAVGTQAITDREIGGDNFKEIDFAQPTAGFLLVDWGDIVDATAMTHFHMDYWTDTPLQTGMIANPKWSNHVGNNGETSAFELTNPVTTFGEWVSVDVPLADFDQGDPTQQRDALRQFILTVVGADPGTRKVFLDNIYLHDNTTLNTNDFSAAEISAYPNPVVNDLNISSVENISQITIYNILGQIVLQEAPNRSDVTLNVSQLQSGTYIARVTTDSGSQTVKVIKR
ncbi:T9SS type A sorting domain-containing protein [Aureitalea sp. L0-47]|uniref:T9SS type A sorting domain-containing protein n=1 Tax=Aureitalea sp. L0-47 TaxID=2816962 RepID=UPI0022389D61|nr:T9SS type A sorting domain-containing protein [Aureitalea sp. L0-47]MCW5518520.1 T9SS type A sorting domain-containing protein [Aureitalea sp. L0-47]